MRISVIWRNTALYALTCLVCLAYALFIDIRFGLPFLLVLVALPPLLHIVNIFALRGFRLEGEASARVLRKGETVRFTLRLKSAAPAFVFLRLTFRNPPHFTGDDDKNLVFIPWPRAEQLEKIYTAALWGVAAVGVRSLEGTDFFGLCRYEFKAEALTASLTPEVEILPDLPDLQETDLLRELLAVRVADDEEEEETRDAPPYAAGMPGFEHRAYIPGDQLKRVNWKLSARLGAYMVRLNEPAARVRVALILDRSAPGAAGREKQAENWRREERLVEVMLGLTLLFVRAGLSCTVHVFSGGRWRGETPETEDDVREMQYKMARFRFLDDLVDRLTELPEIEPGTGTALLLSNRTDALAEMAAALKQTGAEATTLTAQNRGGAWRVTPDFALVRAGL
ncbi:MAG: DUF58 domain-containing protein [Gracilibacteraceae bacterium]|jgi:uncharacterized protein (DUF58 family)|nr:DUF58 domain-containing protein [Gracilibacteraceae bacterium]